MAQVTTKSDRDQITAGSPKPANDSFTVNTR
jgi:hypothetical protein